MRPHRCRHRCLLSLIALLGAGLCHAALLPVDLRCEYLREPLGLDIPRPRLSWRLDSTGPQARDEVQTAYRIQVAGSRSELLAGHAGLWDSGAVTGATMAHVAYDGAPLSGFQVYWWRVRVRDGDGTWSPWSEATRWTTGLLDPNDWQAAWIGAGGRFAEIETLPPADSAPADPWLRRTVRLPARPRFAQILVASVGYHQLYVNGRRVADGELMPPVTDHTQRARTVAYEIQDSLRAGDNVIGIWLGTAWSVYPLYRTPDKPPAPLVSAQAECRFADGTRQRFVTDGTWRTRPSPNYLLGHWHFRHFGGEYYDAMREDRHWSAGPADPNVWHPVTVYHPHLRLSAARLEPNRRVRTVRPRAIERIDDHTYRVDFGVNFAGMLEVDLRGEPGSIVTLRHSERADRPMTHGLWSAYRLGPSGRGTFQHRFNYMTGRWLRLEGLAAPPRPEDIRGYLVRTDYERTGFFTCSNALLNRIYDTTVWTFENLSLGGYVVDCPQRERMGYGGDAHATTQTALNTFGLAAFYSKWAEDWRDVQGKPAAWGLGDRATNQEAPQEPGNLAYTAPTYWGGGGPAWSGYCVTLPAYLHRHYGDTRLLAQQWPTITAWLDFLETRAENDLLVRWGGQWDFLGDWLWPGAKGVNGDTPETLFFNNCVWVYNLRTAARIATARGDEAGARRYRHRAATVARAVHARFYDPNGPGYMSNRQAGLAAALLAEIPPVDLRPAIWRRLEHTILVEHQGHFGAGITGGYFVVKALLEADRSDLLLTMALQESYPGWGDLLARGATTWWEDWEGRLSRLHSSYLHIGAWFIEGLAGIRPGPRGGYQEAEVRPALLRHPDLTWVRGRLETPWGQIASRWRCRGEDFEVTVRVPPNTHVTLRLPDQPPRRLGSGTHTVTSTGTPLPARSIP